MTKLGIHGNSWRFLHPKNATHYADHFAQTSDSGLDLARSTTKRQFKTAFTILKRMNAGQRGVLLADDVGLGKTSIAVFIALVFAGKNKRVRILAPNATMVRRWRQELDMHVAPIQTFATHLDLDGALRRTGDHVERLHPGKIAVSTQRKAEVLACDLLIIDEVHRTRGVNSEFAHALRNSRKSIGHVLMLTATPFSIDPKDLTRLLSRVGGRTAGPPTRKYAAMLDDLWHGRRSGCPADLADELAALAKDAIDQIRPFLIRHSVSDLSKHEKKFFGNIDHDWGCVTPAPPPELLEAMLRTDRALILGRKSGAWKKTRTNDPRHHVGVGQLKRDLQVILNFPGSTSSHHTHAVAHAREAERLLKSNGRHAKIASTVDLVREVIGSGEKVLVFCDHHSTANELAATIAGDLRWPAVTSGPGETEWKETWQAVFRREAQELSGTAKKRFDRYLDWLCSEGIRAQILSWLGSATRPTAKGLRGLLKSAPARGSSHCDSIADHARRLYRQLTDKESTSTRSILSNPNSRGLPGHQQFRVAAVCDPGEHDTKYRNVFFPKEPDATLAVFNSPLGPDVLIATDRLSEGIDLHYFCRYLIHHELDPSPIRTVQRNGRIRRVNSWGARSNQPIRISYPALGGTRDEKLVEIMRYRLAQFDLLLGGVRSEIDVVDEAAAPSTTLEILEHAASRLSQLRLSL